MDMIMMNVVMAMKEPFEDEDEGRRSEEGAPNTLKTPQPHHTHNNTHAPGPALFCYYLGFDPVPSRLGIQRHLRTDGLAPTLERAPQMWIPLPRHEQPLGIGAAGGIYWDFGNESLQMNLAHHLSLPYFSRNDVPRWLRMQLRKSACLTTPLLEYGSGGGCSAAGCCLPGKTSLRAFYPSGVKDGLRKEWIYTDPHSFGYRLRRCVMLPIVMDYSEDEECCSPIEDMVRTLTSSAHQASGPRAIRYGQLLVLLAALGRIQKVMHADKQGSGYTAMVQESGSWHSCSDTNVLRKSAKVEKKVRTPSRELQEEYEETSRKHPKTNNNHSKENNLAHLCGLTHCWAWEIAALRRNQNSMCQSAIITYAWAIRVVDSVDSITSEGTLGTYIRYSVSSSLWLSTEAL
ncbi:hypothetical protein Tco_0000741 [Tanacetum coccineum]